MICPFCENEVPEFHPNSHIVPEWLYKISFGEKYTSYSVDLRKEEVKPTQSGVKKSFICKNCESRFGEDDRFASLVFGPKTKSQVKNIADAEKIPIETQFGYLKKITLKTDFQRIQKFV